MALSTVGGAGLGDTTIFVPVALSAERVKASAVSTCFGSRCSWYALPPSTTFSTLPDISVALPPLLNVTPSRSMTSPMARPLITLVGIAVLPICSVPPAVVNVMAPEATAPVPSSRIPPLIVVAIVVPPEATSSMPPLSILVLVTFPLPPRKATFWCDPLPTMVLIAVPVPPNKKPTN